MYANRGDRIWTYGRPLPKRVLYQTELHPVKKYVSDILQNSTDGHKGGPTPLPRGLDFRFFFLSETWARMYSSPVVFIITPLLSSVNGAVGMDCWERKQQSVLFY